MYDEPKSRFEIRIENSNNRNDPCLQLTFKEDEHQNTIGKLLFVRTFSVKCLVPQTEPAKWMIRLSEAIFSSLGMDTEGVYLFFEK